MIATPVSSSEVMGFGSLDIHFDDSVLRPRPWTIAQSMWADELLIDAPDGAVLELCSGVGHMGIMLASLVSRNVVLVDVDVATISLLQERAVRQNELLAEQLIANRFEQSNTHRAGKKGFAGGARRPQHRRDIRSHS